MQPLSLEDLLKKKQLEQDEATKVCNAADVTKAADVRPLKARLTLDHPWLQPKFLSKKQREELALKRRADEVKEQRDRYSLCTSAHLIPDLH